MKRFLPTLAVLTCAATTVSAAPRAPSAQKAPAVQQVVQPVAPQVAAAAERPSRRDMVRRILGHSVRFMVYDGQTARRTASGVAIATETNAEGAFSYVLTNAHAVDTRGLSDPRFSVLVEDRGDVSEFFARPVAVGSVPDMDLALVKVRGVSLPAVALAEDAELELGDDVVVAAAPYGKALSISGGMISQVEWDRETRRPLMLKTDAPIGYGASGGGIYSLATGKLVAIVEGYRTAKIGFEVGDQPYSFDVPMPGETFASPSGKVRGFLEAKGFGHILQPVQAAAGTVSAAVR
jgi:S1-C subfamily serine protease